MILERLGKYVEALEVVQGPLGGEEKKNGVLQRNILDDFQLNVFVLLSFARDDTNVKLNSSYKCLVFLLVIFQIYFGIK